MMHDGTIISLISTQTLEIFIDGSAYLVSREVIAESGDPFIYSGGEFNGYSVFKPKTKAESYYLAGYSNVRNWGVLIPSDVLNNHSIEVSSS